MFVRFPKLCYPIEKNSQRKFLNVWYQQTNLFTLCVKVAESALIGDGVQGKFWFGKQRKKEQNNEWMNDQPITYSSVWILIILICMIVHTVMRPYHFKLCWKYQESSLKIEIKLINEEICFLFCFFLLFYFITTAESSIHIVYLTSQNINN